MTKRRGGASTLVTESYTILSGASFTILVSRTLAATHQGAAQTLVQAASGNAGTVYVGGPNSMVIELAAGESVTIPVDPSLIHVTGADQAVQWIAVG